MSGIVDIGCGVADVYHRYHAIHNALFGAASFRLIIDALRGHRQRAYGEFSQSLKGLQDELVTLKLQIKDMTRNEATKGRDRELQQVLSDYAEALGQAIAGLDLIFTNLRQDESAYRDTGVDGRSGFTRDKVQYDHLLATLERLGTRLNRLFANY